MNLEMLSEKTVHQTVDPHLIAYCPSMDLVALGSSDQQVLVYRLNGQRVYGATQKAGTLHVENIHWKPNGLLTTCNGFQGPIELMLAQDSCLPLLGVMALYD